MPIGGSGVFVFFNPGARHVQKLKLCHSTTPGPLRGRVLEWHRVLNEMRLQRKPDLRKQLSKKEQP
jgi:hypothetical protein